MASVLIVSCNQIFVTFSFLSVPSETISLEGLGSKIIVPATEIKEDRYQILVNLVDKIYHQKEEKPFP